MALMLLGTSCRGEYEVLPSTTSHTQLEGEQMGNLVGVYLLNEGNMGSNKASIDYLHFPSGLYHHNIYAERNPQMVKELGDVGNDLQIYGSKLYATINVSNYIEVMNAYTGHHIGSVQIPNVRYITFHNGKAYASSYVAPVDFNQGRRTGMVCEIDTTTLQITRRVAVGYQPEELVVVGDKLYVANSGGYLHPTYDRTISVVDLDSFQEERKIDVAINLHRLRHTQEGELLVTSRGNHADIAPRTLFVNPTTGQVTASLDIAISDLHIIDNKAYFIGNSYKGATQKSSFGILCTTTKQLLPEPLIPEAIARQIRLPYGIKVNPVNGDRYITDAIDYVTPGTLFCISKEGQLKWQVNTGEIPAHITFLYQP